MSDCPSIEEVIDLCHRLSEPGGDALRNAIEANPALLVDEFNLNISPDDLPANVKLPDQGALDELVQQYQAQGASAWNGDWVLFLVDP